MNFIHLSILFVIITFFIFLAFSKKGKNNNEKVRNSIINAITFNSGLMLFLYVIGNVLSIDYFKTISEDLFLFAILVASVVLMSSSGDKYYSEIKKKIKGGKSGK